MNSEFESISLTASASASANVNANANANVSVNGLGMSIASVSGNESDSSNVIFSPSNSIENSSASVSSSVSSLSSPNQSDASHSSTSSPVAKSIDFNSAYLHWEFLPFSSLSVHSLYSILKLRQDVFVIEQNTPFDECDNCDQMSMHLCGWYKIPQNNNITNNNGIDENNINNNNAGDSKGELIAYLRYIPANVKYHEPSIGRVLNSYQYRGLGIGRLLLSKSIEYLKLMPEHIKNHKIPAIRIGAQKRLKKLYMEFGFEFTGLEYLEYDQPYLEMLRPEQILS